MRPYRIPLQNGALLPIPQTTPRTPGLYVVNIHGRVVEVRSPQWCKALVASHRPRRTEQFKLARICILFTLRFREQEHIPASVRYPSFLSGIYILAEIWSGFALKRILTRVIGALCFATTGPKRAAPAFFALGFRHFLAFVIPTTLAIRTQPSTVLGPNLKPKSRPPNQAWPCLVT
jgi:hypothetical protein